MKTASRFDAFPPYTPIEPFDVLSKRLGRPVDQIVKLDANENPYGPSPRARQALANLAYAHIYPDPESRALRAALAQFTGAPADLILPGSGADELIDLLLRVMLEPGDVVVNCPPTFGMYPFDTRLNDGQVVDVPRRADFSIDVEAILQVVAERQPKVLFLTSPNNPDGSLLAAADLDRLLELPLLVVLDEAYIEFTGAGQLGLDVSRIREVARRENLIVLRTFSKWAGLAGLRVGYGAFPAWMMPILWKAKQPYNVNVAASEAALASLADLEYLSGNVDRLRAERARLFAALRQVPFLRPIPSESNFILCEVLDRSAADLKDDLAARGVLLRYYNNDLLKNFIRASVGRPQDTQALVSALRDIQAGIPPAAASPALSTPPALPPRSARVERKTGETQVQVKLTLDGTGQRAIRTGLPFFDHMLEQIAVHGQFDLTIAAQGDLEVDAHHTVEDVGLALGAAFAQALGDRAGLVRAASFEYPMDETLARVALDFSGRPYAVVNLAWRGQQAGGLPVSLFEHFLESFAAQARCTLHAQVAYGRDDHHIAEAVFKALGRALDAATQIDPRRAGQIPSSKGVL